VSIANDERRASATRIVSGMDHLRPRLIEFPADDPQRALRFCGLKDSEGTPFGVAAPMG